MTKMTDSELLADGFMVLVQRFGDVNAERFIALTNRAPADYTKWRETHMYVGESVRETAVRSHDHATMAEKLFPRCKTTV